MSARGAIHRRPNPPCCPKCLNSDLRYRKRTGLFVCADCGIASRHDELIYRTPTKRKPVGSGKIAGPIVYPGYVYGGKRLG